MTPGRVLKTGERDQLLELLQTRFERNTQRHADLTWQIVRKRLDAHPEKLWSLHEMERTGGEPDVIARGKNNGTIVFADCSAESPAGRRSLCFDREALESRKKHKPKDSAEKMAADMGIELLSEDRYRELQRLGKFDTKTSSWVQTPADIRDRGSALFCDRRYGHVFTYHNGAESYYAARGFRGCLIV